MSFQIIQFHIGTHLNVKIFLFQIIQFSISTQFSSIWPTDRTLSSATTPGQSWPGSDGSEVVLLIPQSSTITGTSPSDCSVSFPGYSLVGVLPLCRDAVDIFYSSAASRLGKHSVVYSWWRKVVNEGIIKLVYRYIQLSFFILEKVWSFCDMNETEKWRKTKTDSYTDP